MKLKFTDYFEKSVSVHGWDTLEDYQNGNGARANVNHAEIELVDQCYGWEYRALASDGSFVSFDYSEIYEILDDRCGYVSMVVISSR